MCRLYNVPGMLKVFLCGISFMLLMNEADAQIKIGTNGSIIAPSSILELESANQGLLLPRLADTVGINALSPPNGTMIYLTKSPAIGLYVRKVTGWEYLTGSLGGNGNFNSLTVANTVTAGSFSGPLNGNASSATLAATATNSLNSAIINDLTTSAPVVAYPTFVTVTPGNAPLRTSNTNLSFVPSTGILTAKGFNGPLVGNVTGNATSALDAQNTVNVKVTNDLTTSTPMYPLFTSGTSGPLPARASNTNLNFIPLTGELSAPIFKGDLNGNARSATTVTGIVETANGGTGYASYAQGDILVAGTSNRLDRLPVGVPGTVLRVNASFMPEWSTAGAGTVTNVTGVTDRIKVTNNTVAPIIDIAANYIGQTSITTVGNLSSGSLTGNFTPVNVVHGGTGLPTLPTALLVGNGTSPVTTVTGPLGYVLTSTGTTTPPVFSASGGGDMILSSLQSVSGAKTFEFNKLIISGSAGRLTTLNASTGVGSTTIELPPDGIIVNRDRTETLFNKTLNSPILVTPDIGTATGTSLTTTGSVTAPIFVSNISTGTAPLTVNSTTPVANLSIGGNAATASTATSFSGSLAGDVTGTQNATVVSSVAGFPSGTIGTRLTAVGNATSAPTANTIVSRGVGGNFSAGTITADLTGTVTGSLIGNAQTASNAGTATNADNTAINNDNASAAVNYPTFVTGTTGNLPQKTSSLGLTYVPSTGLLTAIRFASTVATGQAPFTVLSTTAVPNLSIGGNAGTASALFTARNINGVAFDGTANITVTAAANTLTGTVLAPGVVTSSLTTLGTITAGTWNGTVLTGQYGGTGVANTGKTLTLGGNFTTSGANALTLTTTGTTNVTLPVSGTLYGDAASSISSANLIGSLTDETGSASAVFSNAPTLVTPILGAATANSVRATNIALTFALGTSATNQVINGSNLGGNITFDVNGTAVAGDALITINYSTNFPTGSYPLISPASAPTAGLGNAGVFATGINSSFTIYAGSTPPPAGTYSWNYMVVGN
jgi:hypothetical protein